MNLQTARKTCKIDPSYRLNCQLHENWIGEIYFKWSLERLPELSTQWVHVCSGGYVPWNTCGKFVDYIWPKERQ
jgi:hypothetical protein